MEKPAGNLWLQQHFGLQQYPLTHRSYIGTHPKIELFSTGEVDEIYRARYAVKEDTPLHHLEFALKYDDLSLDFLKAVFKKMPLFEIATYVSGSPSGRYERRIGFFYEMLTGEVVPLQGPVKGNYIDLIDPEKYITGKTIKSTKWHINDNLLGDFNFCPVVRKTRALEGALEVDLKDLIEELTRNYPKELFQRASSYLYTKETRSSFLIEREKPTMERESRFIGLLAKAGHQTDSVLLSEENLVSLQNAIVDPRFAAHSFRHFQNYIGESLPNYIERIHYICPPPNLVRSLMEGLKNTAIKAEGVHPAVKAAILAFGFVFVHPFEDGNGRLHRFLIHDILSREGLVPPGLVIPVSAHMVSHLRDYENALEAYSVPLMQRVRYDKTADSELTITNEGAVEGYFKYPDLTPQVTYLARTISATITGDMTEELEFLLHYDSLRREMQAIVDMPDRDINRFILFTHQNKGVFPKRRRADFAKLTDDEISKLQEAYQDIFDTKK